MKRICLAIVIISVSSSVTYGQVKAVKTGSFESLKLRAEAERRAAERAAFGSSEKAWRSSVKLTVQGIVPEAPRGESECLEVSKLADDSVCYLERWQFEVLQVIGPEDVVLTLGNPNVPNIWLAGHSTEDLVDGANVRLLGLVEVDGTKTHTTPTKGSKTIRVVRLVSKEKLAEMEAKAAAGEAEAERKRKEAEAAKEAKSWRTWTTADGKFTVEAKLVSIGFGKARLEKRDGTTVDVKPDVLSPEDQDFIEEWKRARNRRPQKEELEEESAAKSIPKDVTYTIIDKNIVPGIKRSLDIRLNRKVSEDVLEAIAVKLRSSDAANYERTFIGYYLPGMKVDSGYWATTHFNPDLEVRILGLALDEEGTLTDRVDVPNREYIGSWLDERPYLANRTVIFKMGAKVSMENTYKDGSTGRTELVEIMSQRGRRFEKAGGSPAGEYYLITSSGRLELWDDEGRIFQANAISRRVNQ